MDPTALSDAARMVISYIAPLIAGGALAKIGEEATDTSLELLGKAWDALGRFVRGDRKAEAALTLFEDEPQDAGLQRRLTDQVLLVVQHDQAAANELLALAQAIRAGQPAAPSQQRQIIARDNAQIGTVITGDIHGNLTLGPVDMSRKTFISGTRPSTPPTQPTAGSSLITHHSSLPTTLSSDGVHFSFGHALLIGVGAYANAYISVAGTANDAEHLAALLRDPATAAYPAEQVQLLSNAQAGRSQILAALDAFAARLRQAPQATALLFFAGHGFQRGEQYYLLPHDANLNRLSDTGIDAKTFRSKVAAIAEHCQKLLVLLNCCHAGGVGDAVLAAGEPLPGDAPPPGFYEPLAAGSGRVVISSSRPAERSGARSSADAALTVFGAQLVAGLRGAARGSGPAVTLFDLFRHLATAIPDDARQITDPQTNQPLRQHPLIYTHQVDSDFALTLRPREQRGGTLAPPDDAVQQLIELEVQLAAYPSEVAAPAELLARRDRLLAELEEH